MQIMPWETKGVDSEPGMQREGTYEADCSVRMSPCGTVVESSGCELRGGKREEARKWKRVLES